MKKWAMFFSGMALASVVFLAEPLWSPAPASVLVSAEAVAAAEAMRRQMSSQIVALTTGDIAARRATLDQYYYQPRIDRARRLYPVDERVLEIDGVYTEVFEPAAGVPAKNVDRVLIHLHGGAFSFGARTGGRLESIPVAHVAGMRVISVDYRQGPEHRFPAASEDVATVYRHLLQSYSPQQIGIFGCSAGGLLTAQVVAWFDAQNLPQPGAIGIFCAGAGRFGVGDSLPISRLFGSDMPLGDIAYLRDVDISDALVSPLDHAALLARFPPTLVVSSTRDFALSPALATHQRLVAAGVEAELHVYEGLDHFFFADTELPESRHLFNVIADFFDRFLSPLA